MDYRHFLKKKNSYDIDIISAANYLLELHYNNNCEFTISKIEKMLVIYKLCCMKNNEVCFDKYFSVKTTDFRIPILSRFVFMSFKRNYIIEDEKITEEKNTHEISKAYKLSEINSYTKEILNNIFEYFKVFSYNDIKDMLQDIRFNLSCIKINDEYCLSNNDIKNFFDNSFYNQLYNDNKVYKFVKNTNFYGKDLNETIFDISKVSKYFDSRFSQLSFDDQIKVLEYIDETFQNCAPKVKKIEKTN